VVLRKRQPVRLEEGLKESRREEARVDVVRSIKHRKRAKQGPHHIIGAMGELKKGRRTTLEREKKGYPWERKGEESRQPNPNRSDKD